MGNRTIIAFDFGTKSIGAAIGQEVTGTARPLASFKPMRDRQTGRK
jgi:putative holliday junction resolvase